MSYDLQAAIQDVLRDARKVGIEPSADATVIAAGLLLVWNEMHGLSDALCENPLHRIAEALERQVCSGPAPVSTNFEGADDFPDVPMGGIEKDKAPGAAYAEGLEHEHQVPYGKETSTT